MIFEGEEPCDALFIAAFLFGFVEVLVGGEDFTFVALFLLILEL